MSLGRHSEVRDVVLADAGENIAQLEKVRGYVNAAFEMLRRDVTADSCSPEFHRQMRRVAFEPDGLNEFLYAPAAPCSARPAESTSKLP
jgi:hypothetical protein